MLASRAHRDVQHRSGQLDEAKGPGQERGHLGPRNDAIGAVAQRVAAAARGDARGRQCVDALGVDTLADVVEARRPSLSELERPLEERRHLGPGDIVVGTVPCWLAAAARGDFELEQPLDVTGPPLFFVDVRETARRCGLGI